jgi:hypothetical protein
MNRNAGVIRKTVIKIRESSVALTVGIHEARAGEPGTCIGG